MNQNTLTEKQKELLRKIVEADNSGKLPESSIVHTIRGDDVYNLLGLGIKLQSLADLECPLRCGIFSEGIQRLRSPISNQEPSEGGSCK